MDVRLLYLTNYKLQNVQEVPSAISFSSIHCENDEVASAGDACSSYTQDDTSVTSAEMEEEEDDLLGFSYTQDDTSVEMEEEDDLLGLDLLLDDEEEEDFNLDEMVAEAI
jgi:hypothetical protein